MKLVPDFLTRPLTLRLKAVADEARLFLPSHQDQASYCLKTPTSQATLPIPPLNLFADMADSAEAFIQTGKIDVAGMNKVLQDSGYSLADAKRILDFGCAAGRMIRCLPELTQAELWGVDISAEHIQWCINNLPMHFAVSSIVPHLPFEDRFFDLIYCGSIFTHIEDNRETWLLELARILKPGGVLYLTIHDEHTLKLFETGYKDRWLAKKVSNHPTYLEHKSGFDMLVIGRGWRSQVFYNSAYFRAKLPPVFSWTALVPEAYGYQSAVVLKKT